MKPHFIRSPLMKPPRHRRMTIRRVIISYRRVIIS